jgi:hypothetical protein
MCRGCHNSYRIKHGGQCPNCSWMSADTNINEILHEHNFPSLHGQASQQAAVPRVQAQAQAQVQPRAQAQAQVQPLPCYAGFNVKRCTGGLRIGGSCRCGTQMCKVCFPVVKEIGTSSKPRTTSICPACAPRRFYAPVEATLVPAATSSVAPDQQGQGQDQDQRLDQGLDQEMKHATEAVTQDAAQGACPSTPPPSSRPLVCPPISKTRRAGVKRSGDSDLIWAVRKRLNFATDQLQLVIKNSESQVVKTHAAQANTELADAAFALMAVEERLGL